MPSHRWNMVELIISLTLVVSLFPESCLETGQLYFWMMRMKQFKFHKIGREIWNAWIVESSGAPLRLTHSTNLVPNRTKSIIAKSMHYFHPWLILHFWWAVTNKAEKRVKQFGACLVSHFLDTTRLRKTTSILFKQSNLTSSITLSLWRSSKMPISFLLMV